MLNEKKQKMVKHSLGILINILCSIVLSAQEPILFEIKYLKNISVEIKEQRKTNSEYKEESIVFQIQNLKDTVLFGKYGIKVELWEQNWGGKTTLVNKDSLSLKYNLNSQREEIVSFLNYMDNSLYDSKAYEKEEVLELNDSTRIIEKYTIKNTAIDSISIFDFNVHNIEKFEELLFSSFQDEGSNRRLQKIYKRENLNNYIESQLAEECRYSRLYAGNSLFLIKWKNESDKSWNTLIKVISRQDPVWTYNNVFGETDYSIVSKKLDEIVMFMVPFVFSKRTNIWEFYVDNRNLIQLVKRELEAKYELIEMKKH